MLNNFAFNPIKKIFQYFLTPIKRWFLNDIIYKLNIIESRIVAIQDTVTEKNSLIRKSLYYIRYRQEIVHSL